MVRIQFVFNVYFGSLKCPEQIFLLKMLEVLDWKREDKVNIIKTHYCGAISLILPKGICKV